MSRAVVVRSGSCLLHEPGAEIWVGVRTPGTELPERAVRIEEELRTAAYDVREAVTHDDDVLLRVHDRRLIEHLRTVHQRWMASPIPGLVGQDRVVPYLMPTAGMLTAFPSASPSRSMRRPGATATTR